MELGVVFVTALIAHHMLLRAVGVDVSQLTAVVACLSGESIDPGCIGMLFPAVVIVLLVIKLGLISLDTVVAL